MKLQNKMGFLKLMLITVSIYLVGLKKRAITVPMRERNSRSQWSEWEKNSVVSYPTFLKRIRSGWDPEKAALTQGIRIRKKEN